MELIKPVMLDKTSIGWKSYHKLDRASLGQIMRTFEHVKINPKNKYEQILSEELKLLISHLMNAFDEILICTNYCEYQVYSFNLLGDMPFGTRIFDEHRKICLRTANIGSLLKALNQRINFILTREVPVVYKINKGYFEAFEKMKVNLTKFLVATKNFEEGFVRAVDNAHKNKKIFKRF